MSVIGKLFNWLSGADKINAAFDKWREGVSKLPPAQRDAEICAMAEMLRA